jgi:phosphoenolpyruvate carboxykinase (GTP)
MRVLKWIIERSRGKVTAIESPIGWMPKYEDIDWTGLNFPRDAYDRIMEVDREAWKTEIMAHEELFARMYDKLPKEYFFMRELLLSSLWRSPEHWYLEPETH